ncbi:DUF4249 domain-containing protein [Hymenobacter sp. 15J16-1T3B]|uniref:DUF4249 domain-containing protein n=1 Tax=Hymenobacter sp. 15J16-1T3B TaxID=2886941 RepID=UPI001D10A007|nr:DUF4249 domain-containing protein [Hymenobacter sp. 15J16-1T3B]MCC3158120.1 DUF4249 domain-containing protein [Hymenobacter sp. 15J16-1T3B]
MPFLQPDFRRNLLPLALLPALLTACDTAIDVPEPAHTPRVAMVLTLDNLAPADSLMRASYLGRQPFVSLSQRLYLLHPPEGRADATMEVRDAGGAVVERYRQVVMPPPFPGAPDYNQGVYRPTLRYQFRPGQTYTVRTAVPGTEPAESQLTLPVPVPVEVTKTPLSSSGSGQSRARLTVAFDDPAGSNDYYLVTAQVVDASGQRVGYINLSDEEGSGLTVPAYRLSDPQSAYELYPFSDANVNGQRISFSANVSYGSGSIGGRPAQLQVTLTRLTRDLYLFYNSYVQYSNNDGNPFAEPTPLYSNVTPGFGIFGGAADSWVRLPL